MNASTAISTQQREAVTEVVAGERWACCGADLVLAQQRQVQEDLEGLRVRSHDDELGDATVQRFGGCRWHRGDHVRNMHAPRRDRPGSGLRGEVMVWRTALHRVGVVLCLQSEGCRTLVGALLQLLVVGSLLGDVKDGDGELRIRQREGLRVGSVSLRRQVGANGQLFSRLAEQSATGQSRAGGACCC